MRIHWIMNIFPVNHLLDTIFSDSKYYCLTCSEFKEFTNKDFANLPFYVPRYDALNLFIKSRTPFSNLGFTEVLNPFEFGGCFKTRPSLQPAPPQKKIFAFMICTYLGILDCTQRVVGWWVYKYRCGNGASPRMAWYRWSRVGLGY